MIKIVLISPRLQYYRLTFYEKLSQARKDYNLTVLYGRKKQEDGKLSFSGSTRFAQCGFNEVKIRIYPFNIVYNVGLYSKLKEINPDILIIQGITGDLSNRLSIRWAYKKSKKIIIWNCSWEPGRAKGLFLKIKNKLVSSFFRKADYFLSYSTYANKYAISMGINESIVETCFNGIELDSMIENSDKILLKSRKIISEYDLENYITFLYVGGLIARKRLDLLINAFNELRKNYSNIKLMIIGDGPEMEKIEKLINALHDNNIYLLGRIVEDVDSYFAASDCFVLPGTGGLALNQAMFWGRPCIVSRADGTEDDLVIDNITGYRFEEGNINSLIDAMKRRINESPEKLSMMSIASKDIIEKKSNVNNMVRVFTNAIEKMKDQINSLNNNLLQKHT